MVAFSRFGAAGVDRLECWLASFDPEFVPVDKEQADAAFLAFQTYGKGVHARARLNMGDCASYALAKSRGLPLLFKGDDFIHTDLQSAM